MALQYLELQRNAQPELADWYGALADLYRRKMWHQLTVKIEQFVALAVVQAGDALIQLYHNFIMDFETKINLLKLSHFVVVVSRQYSDKDAAINYLKKRNQKECKKILEEGKSTLDSMTDVDPSVHANYYWISSQYHKCRQEFSEFYKSSLLYLAYTSVESLSASFKLVHLIEGIIDQVEGTVIASWVQPRVLGIPQIESLQHR